MLNRKVHPQRHLGLELMDSSQELCSEEISEEVQELHHQLLQLQQQQRDH